MMTGPTFLPALRSLAAILALASLAGPAMAAEGPDGRSLGLAWSLPFVGMLLSIALGPLLVPHFWEDHRGKISAFWALLAIIPMAIFAGPGTTLHAVAHTALLEYIPFILLLLALFTVAGGIVIRGNLHGTPLTNTVLLAIGTLMASVIGTTGAAMIMIRPVIRANDHRKSNAHVVVFFIFLVANAGGALTPLGDPPLFLGFLRGVDFFWPTFHLFLPTAFLVAALLGIFFLFDSWIGARAGELRPDPTPDRDLSVAGGINFLLIPAIIAAILFSSSIDLGGFSLFGTPIAFANLARDLAFIVIAMLSIGYSPRGSRAENNFSWEPIKEVAELFAGIFITIIPVLAMLRAGSEGAFAPLVDLVAQAGRHRRQSRLFLGDGRPLVLPRQCPDLYRVLRTGRRRPAVPHDPGCGDACRHFAGCRLHGRQHLYRQRPELHGLCHRPRRRRPHAEFLRLHALVMHHIAAALRAAVAPVLPELSTVSRRPWTSSYPP